MIPLCILNHNPTRLKILTENPLTSTEPSNLRMPIYDRFKKSFSREKDICHTEHRTWHQKTGSEKSRWIFFYLFFFFGKFILFVISTFFFQYYFYFFVGPFFFFLILQFDSPSSFPYPCIGMKGERTSNKSIAFLGRAVTYKKKKKKVEKHWRTRINRSIGRVRGYTLVRDAHHSVILWIWKKKKSTRACICWIRNYKPI